MSLTTGKPIQLYILTGFLGSGKTTLLQNMLSQLSEKNLKAGVIVNEFGQVGVDGSVVKHQGIEMVELNDGQIFCGCIAGKFVKTIATFASLPLDYLIVECSGLANPTSLDILLKDVRKLTGEKYNYRGMICLVDPVKFSILVKTVHAVEEQIIRSQYIIINKTDLVDKETLAETAAKIRELNPTAPIYKTSFAKIESDLFDLDLSENICNQKFIERNVKTPFKRPKHYLIRTKETINQAQLKKFAEIITENAFRVKGFVHSDEGWIHLDVVNDDIQLRPIDPRGSESEIVVISSIGEKINPIIESAWQEILGLPASIKENVFNPSPKSIPDQVSVIGSIANF